MKKIINNKKILIIILVVVITIILLLTGYIIYNKNNNSNYSPNISEEEINILKNITVSEVKNIEEEGNVVFELTNNNDIAVSYSAYVTFYDSKGIALAKETMFFEVPAKSKGYQAIDETNNKHSGYEKFELSDIYVQESKDTFIEADAKITLNDNKLLEVEVRNLNSKLTMDNAYVTVKFYRNNEIIDIKNIVFIKTIGINESDKTTFSIPKDNKGNNISFDRMEVSQVIAINRTN